MHTAARMSLFARPLSLAPRVVLYPMLHKFRPNFVILVQGKFGFRSLNRNIRIVAKLTGMVITALPRLWKST